MKKYLKWLEIDSEALLNNFSGFQKLAGKNTEIYSVIKANAYGHGLLEIAEILKNSTYGFAVNHIDEAISLRKNGIKNPILVLGYILLNQLHLAAENNISICVYNKETIDKLGKIGKPIKVHIKVETGTSRQGLLPEELLEFAKYIQSYPNIEIEGLYTHFANIEDTTDHSYAELQLAKFQKAVDILQNAKIKIPIKHTACTAAAILFPETYFNAVRVGIGMYGLWPSRETLISAREKGREMINLQPVLTWKTRIAQTKWLEKETPVAYGLTFKTTRRTKIAILPVGYSDGYDRKLSNNSYVVIKGKRAPLLGRVMMNMIVVDVTDIENIKVEDEVILIGKGGMPSDEMAGRIGTINYEVVARIERAMPRVVAG